MEKHIRNNSYLKFAFLLFVLLHSAAFLEVQAQDIEQKLDNLKGISYKNIQLTDTLFRASYEIMVRQPIDHNRPEKGYFEQKLFLSHKDTAAPVVYFLSGYNLSSPWFVSELARYLDANFIHVEHRYFGDSQPDSIDWEYLTIKQSADDHHHIRELLGDIYGGKWISSGISKGGQTVMYYRAFYPDDVHAAVPYVAPLNFAAADPRVDSFLMNVGTAQDRKKIYDLQDYILNNYDESLALFKGKVLDKGYEFTHSMDSVFELSVMETDFAFWQWNGNSATIPDTTEGLDKAVGFMFRVGAPGFFETVSLQRTFSFFVQAYKEIGMYDYNTERVRHLLRAYRSNISNYETFIPPHLHFEYSDSTTRFVKNVLDTAGHRMMYIYGEYDPWSATAYTPPKGMNAVKFVKKKGNHTTRIRSLSAKQQKVALELLREWIE